MSKASEWVNAGSLLESHRPAVAIGVFTFSVSQHGNLSIEGPCCERLLPEQALKLAKFILDTFGDAP